MKTRNFFPLFVICLFIAWSAQAQVYKGYQASQKIGGSDMVRYSKLTGNPDYIRLSPGSQMPMSKSEAWIRQSFHLEEESSWNIIGEEKDALGEVHYRCQQTWHGIPVREAIFIMHTRNGNLISVNGTLFSSIQPVNQLLISGPQAFEQAKKYVGASVYMWEKPQEEALLKQMSGNPEATYLPEGRKVILYDRNTGSFRYSWVFDLYATSPLSRQDVYVDAGSGKVLHALNKIYTTDVSGTAVTKYSGTRTITTDQTGTNAYRLRETGRGNGIQTYDMNQGTNYSSAVDFTDTDNNWNNVNTEQDEVAGDAHWGTEVTYDYYFQKHARNSIDDNGFALISYVHYDNAYGNAYWDGQRMTYGDGDGSTTPFTALDITAHEITHGLTSFTANLDYEFESGALSEGFSDIFGTCAEFFGKPTTANWTCGEDIGIIIRNLANPSASGNPDTYQGTDWDGATQEVHQNSTVCSHWFYRLVMGGSGTNDIGNAFSVVAQGIDKAAAIAFRTLTVYLTSTSDYADARYYSIIAAGDLYGGCSPEVEATADAWYAVGVGAAYTNEVMPEFAADYTTFCTAPVTVQFENQTINANSYLWRFGDGTTSTSANPQHTFSTAGNYNVQLVAYGGATCGTDSLTKTAYISIATGNSAVVSLPSSGAGMTQTCCSGTLYDNGGSGNYSNNSDGSITIAPSGAMSVSLTFASFNMESGYDYLYVYDGPTTASPLIGQYDGASLPNGGVINSTGSSITIQQVTDAGLTEGGFQLSWLCNLPNAAPVTTFTANTTSSCTGVIQFTDHSSNGPVSWFWDFGDGTTSTLQNPLHAYTTSGTYSVTLRSGNSFGNDTLVRSSYITVSLPVAPTASPVTICDSSTATLNASGSGQLDWYDAAVSGNLVGTGSTFITPVLYSTTTYYVEDKLIHASQYGGKTDNSGSGGNFSSTSNIHYEIFDCYTPLTLVSVKVYASGAGNRNIQLRDSAMNVLESASIYIPDGESRITLNFDLPVQNKLQLVGNGAMDLYRNNNGSATYPYTLPGLFSITESSASLPPYNVTGNYYYFYDWEVKEPTCISARIPVLVTVDTCNGTIEYPGISRLTVSPNPTDGLLNLQYAAQGKGSLSYRLVDLTGRVLSAAVLEFQTGVNHYQLDLRPLSNGVYYLSTQGENGSETVRIVKSE